MNWTNDIQKVGDFSYLLGRFGQGQGHERIYRALRRFHNRNLSRHDYWFFIWVPYRSRFVEGWK